MHFTLTLLSALAARCRVNPLQRMNECGTPAPPPFHVPMTQSIICQAPAKLNLYEVLELVALELRSGCPALHVPGQKLPDLPLLTPAADASVTLVDRMQNLNFWDSRFVRRGGD